MSTTNRLLLIGLFLDLLLNGPNWAQRHREHVHHGRARRRTGDLEFSRVCSCSRGFDIVGKMLATGFKSGLLADLLTGLAMVVCRLVVLYFVLSHYGRIRGDEGPDVLGDGDWGFSSSVSEVRRGRATYVERYFSYAVSSGVRLMTLYFLVGAGFQMSRDLDGLPHKLRCRQRRCTACWVIGAGAVIYAMICWRGPAIAAGMLGGGPNLSHNEMWGAMSAAAQAGVTAALLASGIGSGAGAAAAAVVVRRRREVRR